MCVCVCLSPVQAPEHLDCFEVTVALFDILGQLYQKFMDDGCALPHVVDAMEAIDQKLKVCVCVFVHICVFVGEREGV